MVPKRKTSGSDFQYWKEANGWVQTPPFDKPLPYSCRVTLCSRWGASSSNVSPADAVNRSATNKAYARLVDSSHKQTQWVVNFLERKQMIDQITTSAMTLAKAFALLRRGQYSLAAKQLAVPFASGKYRHSKNIGNAWLSLHFGWSPFVDDIYAAVETLQRPPRALKISGQSRLVYPRSGKFDGDGNAIFSSATYSCRMGASQVIVNPVLAQMSALGLVNPATVAWEVVPYSFVVDWFSNVGQILNSYSDFVGIELLDPWTVHHLDYNREYWYSWKKNSWRRDLLTYRTLGVTKPRLHLSAEWPSATRAATAISLLVQHLKG